MKLKPIPKFILIFTVVGGGAFALSKFAPDTAKTFAQAVENAAPAQVAKEPVQVVAPPAEIAPPPAQVAPVSAPVVQEAQAAPVAPAQAPGLVPAEDAGMAAIFKSVKEKQ